MLARQQFDNGGGFAMPPHAQHDAFVGPFHGGSLPDSGDGRSHSIRRHSGMVGKYQTRNLEILGFASSVRPGMTKGVTR
jgi:hypothetical protein